MRCIISVIFYRQYIKLQVLLVLKNQLTNESSVGGTLLVSTLAICCSYIHENSNKQIWRYGDEIHACEGYYEVRPQTQRQRFMF